MKILFWPRSRYPRAFRCLPSQLSRRVTSHGVGSLPFLCASAVKDSSTRIANAQSAAGGCKFGRLVALRQLSALWLGRRRQHRSGRDKHWRTLKGGCPSACRGPDGACTHGRGLASPSSSLVRVGTFSLLSLVFRSLLHLVAPLTPICPVQNVRPSRHDPAR